MSDNIAAMVDPFEATTLDEETELAALTNSLRLADGFRLLFARCNQPSQRNRLMTMLMSEFPPDAILGVHFSEPVPHLLDALRERLPAVLPRAIFVSGLEYSLPVATEAENTPFIANLNTARNSFPSAIPCPLVLWLPEYALTAIVRGAPDFFSIRSGVYFFASSPQETSSLVNAVTTGDAWQVANFSLLEKQERLAAIENLLQDYQALPQSQRDYRVEVQLLERLGHLQDILGQWEMAQKAWHEALKIWRELGNRKGEGVALNNLGSIYCNQGWWAKAEQAHQQSLEICRELGDKNREGQTLGNLGIVYSLQGYWAKAEQAQQQVLEIFRELGNKQGEGQALGNMGNFYQVQGNLTKAEQTYQQSLILKRELKDRHGEGQTLNNLGNVYRDQGRWAEVEQVYHQSLTIKRELGDWNGEGDTLNNLGSAYQQQGRWAEAEQAYYQSLTIKRTLRESNGEGRTLGNLALVKEAEGKIAEAIKFGREAVQVLMTTDDVALLRKIQDWVEEWEKRE